MNCWKLRGSALAIVFLVSASVGAGLSSLPAAWAESPAASGPTVGAPAAKAKKTPEQLRQEIEELTKKIEAEPKVAKNYGRRGLRYHELKEYEKALKDFDRAIAIDPKDARVYGFKADILYDQGKFREALDQLSIGMTLGSDDASTYVRRSILYRKLHQPDKALSDAKKAQELRPNCPDGPFQIGMVLLDLSKYEEAARNLSEAIKLNPTNGEFYYFRSYANSKMNKTNSAIEDRERARQLGYK